tara:strand:- start:1093 stop:2589 length:1497 start_codon:yes stop_codon:yes gene_type:complete
MKNNFLSEKPNKFEFNSFIEQINNSKVGFYSIGLYPASLAYNCALHSQKENILLAPRPGRTLFGAFPQEISTSMDSKIKDRIKKMATIPNKSGSCFNDLSELIKNCNIVILASNSNHIIDDISLAIKLRKSLNREKVVLACLVGSFCMDNGEPFIICEKFPNLGFFTGFHRHGALRNPNDSFTANFCHPNSITALLGAKILNDLSPKIQVSSGVHNTECQYIKAIKNISSIFAGFVNDFHSDKPGMLPTINTVLLSQCFDQAASVSSFIRQFNSIESKNLSLKKLGYGEEMIIAQELVKEKIVEKRDHTFSQLNAVTADVLGSMSLPMEGKPTRNFQAGQVLSSLFLKLKRCPKDIPEFIQWCKKFSLSQGGLEGLKSLCYWPDIYRKFNIKNNNCSMINLIYLCFYATAKEKELIYSVLIDPEQITNYCQVSVRNKDSLELSYSLQGIDIFSIGELFYENIFLDDFDREACKQMSSEVDTKSNYLEVMKLVNKYFRN